MSASQRPMKAPTVSPLGCLDGQALLLIAKDGFHPLGDFRAGAAVDDLALPFPAFVAEVDGAYPSAVALALVDAAFAAPRLLIALFLSFSPRGVASTPDSRPSSRPLLHHHLGRYSPLRTRSSPKW